MRAKMTKRVVDSVELREGTYLVRFSDVKGFAFAGSDRTSLAPVARQVARRSGRSRRPMLPGLPRTWVRRLRGTRSAHPH